MAASLTLTTILFSSAFLAATGVGAPLAAGIVIVATGVQIANSLGFFDSAYESFNQPLHTNRRSGGSW